MDNLSLAQLIRLLFSSLFGLNFLQTCSAQIMFIGRKLQRHGDEEDMAMHNSSAAANHADSDTYEEDGLNTLWIVVCTILILGMQSGFGLLEAGIISPKNQVNILFKNASDLLLGGTLYWLVGFSLAFGDGPGANSFAGSGRWALADIKPDEIGRIHRMFVFQMSFTGTAQGIISGSVAERVRLKGYMLAGLANTIAFSLVTHWVWDPRGWLYQLGVVDIAGAGTIHGCGGAAAFVSAHMLGPRTGRYAFGTQPPPIGNGLNIFLGTFFLWFGWFAFNCGSIFGVQEGHWENIARTATTTMIGSLGGGLTGIIWSLVRSKGETFYITDFSTGILGGLIGTTGCCTLVHPWEAFAIGILGAMIVLGGMKFIDYIKVDDPTGAVSVHGIGGIWGMLAVGLFMGHDPYGKLNKGRTGLLHGGGFKVLGIQTAAILSISAWMSVWTFVLISIISRTPIGFRQSLREETLGADFVEHGLGDPLHQLEKLCELDEAERFQLEHTNVFAVHHRAAHGGAGHFSSHHSATVASLSSTMEVIKAQSRQFRSQQSGLGQGHGQGDAEEVELTSFRVLRSSEDVKQEGLASRPKVE